MGYAVAIILTTIMIEVGMEKVISHIDFVAYMYSVITWNSRCNPVTDDDLI